MYRRSWWVLLVVGAAGCAGESFGTTSPGEQAGQTGQAGQSGGAAGSGESGQGGSGAGGSDAGVGGSEAGNAGAPGGAGGDTGAGGEPGGAGQGGAGAGQGGAGQGGAGQGGAGQGGAGQGGAGQGGAACEPGAFACDGKHLLQCLGDPPALVAKLDCPGTLCDAEQGACLPCVPGEPLGCFDEFTRIVCSKQSTADQMDPCPPEEPYCDPQGKGVCRACIKDEHCKHLPTKETCDKPVCEAHACVMGVDVGKPFPDLGNPICNLAICDVDEEGKLKYGTIPNPQNSPIDNPTDCIKQYCDGGTLITETLAAETACKVGDTAGKCDDKGACQECFAGDTVCVGNSLGVCEVSGQKNQLLATSCASLSKGASPACDGAACVGVASVALGDQHTCAILDNQRVECWGDNKHGQSAAPKELLKTPTPTLVPGLSGVAQLALGSRHSCALLSGGTVHCWGDNSRGQLGVTTVGSSHTPVPVEGLSGVTFLAAGGRTTCALTSDEKLFCWGDGEHGQTFVSAGAAQSLSKPTEVPGAPVFSKVALGHRHGCGLTPNGLVHCWGDPQYTGGATPAKTKVELFGTYAELDVGALHSCARGPGGFYCWGEAGAKLGSTFLQGMFTSVGLLASAGQGLSLGANATCQLTQDGGVDKVQCAGLNNRGQLGGKIQDPQSPVVSALPGASKLAVGGDHACAFAPWDPAKPKDGVLALYCWGANDSGQVGAGNFEDFTTPHRVSW